MDKVYHAVPNYNMKTLLRDLSAKVGKESYLYPACGGHSLHNKTKDNSKQTVHFALGRDLAVMGKWYQHKDIHKVTWWSPDNKICNQTDHILVYRRHCRNVCDVRGMWVAEIESGHFYWGPKLDCKLREVKLRNGILVN